VRRGRFFRWGVSCAVVRVERSGVDTCLAAWSCRRSLRNSSEIVRIRAITSASVEGGDFLLPTKRPPAHHYRRVPHAPDAVAVATLVGGNFRARRNRLGCPTGQTGRSTGRADCQIFLPAAQEFHSQVYEHQTFD
jgi:hypothetical protein